MKDPEEIRRRVILISGINGWSILIVAGLFAVLSLLLGDGLGIMVGAAVLVSPWMELKARARLKGNKAGARKWYLTSQIYLLAVIVVYCAAQLAIFQSSGGIRSLPADVRESLYQLLALDEKALNELVGQIYLAAYGSIMLASLLYQGGLFLYYRRHVPPDAL